jgi:integrase
MNDAQPPSDEKRLTLADALDGVMGDDDLPLSRRKQVRSHIRTFARVQGKRLEDLQADPKAHRSFIKRFHPAKASFSKRHWENVVSSLRFALHHAGVQVIPGQSRVALTEEWRHLYDQLEDQGLTVRLSRFMRFCTARGIRPPAVSDTVLESYLQVLREESFAKEPERAQRLTIRAWNLAVAKVPGWPAILLTLPDRRRRVTTPWSELPGSFVEDVEAWLGICSDPDPLAETGSRRLSPDTIDGRRYQVHCFASALIAVGKPLQELRGLGDLFDPERFKDAVRRLYRHYAKHKTTYRIIQTLRLIARNHLALGDDWIDLLTDLARRVGVEPPGMTENNRAKLRQFDDPRNVARLIHLPARLLARAQRLDRGRRNDALPVQIALAVELLLFAPVRLRNLTGLRLDRHMQWSRAGRKGVCHLIVPGDEVKNGVPLEFPLPRTAVDLLEIYVEHFMPRLASADEPWLFPGRDGGRKSPIVLRSQISRTIREATGLEVNPHLFRHIAAKLHLEAHPGEYEIVRRVLGHTDIKTTTNFYAGTEGAAAARHFDRTILGLRDSTSTLL